MLSATNADYGLEYGLNNYHDAYSFENEVTTGSGCVMVTFQPQILEADQQNILGLVGPGGWTLWASRLGRSNSREHGSKRDSAIMRTNVLKAAPAWCDNQVRYSLQVVVTG